jgi:hypothetical protein
MAAPLNTCTTIEQRGVRFLWAKNMEAKDPQGNAARMGSISSHLKILVASTVTLSQFLAEDHKF